MDNRVSEAAYWSQNVVALSAALGSGASGLSSEQASAKLRQVGSNSVEESSQLSAVRAAPQSMRGSWT